jgi:Polyglycine hydrolase-like, structural repeat
MKFFPVIAAVAIAACALALPEPARAADLVNHGGPVLKSFEIVPFYYGPWKQTAVDEHQKYLIGLTQYISGANAPANSQPTLVQYGVTSAGVADAVMQAAPSTPVNTDGPGLVSIIHSAQNAGKLPPYASNRLILVLLPNGSTVKEHCAYHSAEAVGKYWAVVTQDCNPWLLVSAHEIFEAATDPAIGLTPAHNAWSEAVDPCGTSFTLWFGTIPGAMDNSIHACSTTGYDTTPATPPGAFTAVWTASADPEIQMSGATYSVYRARYDELWGVGWRLHILRPYVVNDNVYYSAVWRPGSGSEVQIYGVPYATYRAKYDALWGQGLRLAMLVPHVAGGQVLYDAVWRPSTEGETQVYGYTYADYRKKYDDLWGKGWRLKLLQPYVVAGNVRYDAVWRPSTEGELQVYGYTYKDYRTKYDALWNQGWRLKLLHPYVVAGNVRYDAVWRPNAHSESQVYGYAYPQYRTRYDQLFPTGFRLEMLDAY